jgi:Lon protease-like protein
VPQRLPLFPLGLVLFPGNRLPLHVFEERYRVLVRELLELPEAERVFGVVAIRQGREVGADGVQALHEIGCVARVERVAPHADGRFDLLTTGTDRFALTGVATDRPYLVGLVEPLGDPAGPVAEARLVAAAVRGALGDYAAALAAATGQEVSLPELPRDPLALGHLVGSTVQVDLADRQSLLAAPDGVSRLRSELSLLRRETALLRSLRAVPTPQLARTPTSPN